MQCSGITREVHGREAQNTIFSTRIFFLLLDIMLVGSESLADIFLGCGVGSKNSEKPKYPQILILNDLEAIIQEPTEDTVLNMDPKGTREILVGTITNADRDHCTEGEQIPSTNLLLQVFV